MCLKKVPGSYAAIDTFSNFTPGTYTFYVQDDNSCEENISVTITEPAQLLLSISVNNSFVTMGTASVTLSASGGTTPYAFDYYGSGTFGSTTNFLNQSDTSGITSAVKDANGCTNTAALLIQHTDATPPVAATKNITVYLDSATGTVTVSAEDLNNGTTDDCSPIQYAVSDSTFNCLNTTSVQTVKFHAIDPTGHADSTKTADITIKDTTAPANLIYAVVDLYLDSSGSGTLTASMVDSASFDACGIDASKTYLGQVAFSCIHAGDTIGVACRIEDFSGNSRTVTAKIAVHRYVCSRLKT